MELSAHQINASTESAAILPKIAAADKTAVKDCIDVHGNLIWALARKYTGSSEEAEAATEEIFLDIWRYARNFDSTKFDEATFIFLIAQRHFKTAAKLISSLSSLADD